jgi:hypothetical protein
VERRSHDVGADPGDERFPNRTQAATPAPSAANTRANTKAGVRSVFTSDALVAKGAHLRRVDHDAPSRQLDRPAFPRGEEPVLAEFWLAPTGAFHESDDPRAGTGVIGLPRAQQSGCARRDGCIARTMRKPDRTKLPAVAALLLSSALRLLVRHAGRSRGRPPLSAESDRPFPGQTTGGIAGARRAPRVAALELKLSARMHHRRTPGVDGRDDLL